MKNPPLFAGSIAMDQIPSIRLQTSYSPGQCREDQPLRLKKLNSILLAI